MSECSKKPFSSHAFHVPFPDSSIRLLIQNFHKTRTFCACLSLPFLPLRSSCTFKLHLLHISDNSNAQTRKHFLLITGILGLNSVIFCSTCPEDLNFCRASTGSSILTRKHPHLQGPFHRPKMIGDHLRITEEIIAVLS